MESTKILLIDDEPDILEFLEYNLLQHNFVVEKAKNGLKGIEKFKSFQPDIILIDVMMPKLNGIETCEKIKSLDNGVDCIIIFLSARNEEFTQIAAYDAGAHDFVNKPVKPKILIKKIQAIIKQKKPTKLNAKNEIRLDKPKHLVFVKDEKIKLTKTQFEILFLLFNHSDIVFNREKIIKEIWGSDYYITKRNVDVQIRQIRKAIGPDKISTIKGLGYKFNSE
tara:strand:+ start:120 stop:788 length:669 start_codon:yes stop_codon:yes gene_type:complete